MSKLVVLSLGNGSLNDGFPTVTAQLWATDHSRPLKFTGSLPPAPNLEELYGDWQLLYTALSETLRNRSGLEIQEGGLTNVSEADFEEVCQQLGKEINSWLNSEQFRHIDQQLRAKLDESHQIRVLIETTDILVQRLPWHLWKFFEDYPQGEVGLSYPEWRVKPQRRNPTKQVRILGILGDSTGIDVQKDREMLNGLPNAKVIFPEKKLQREQLNEQLWGGGWDILFFAGHSKTEGETGKIYINETESLTVDQLRFALQQAIAGGLRLAIFNSCDGLGLARQLADLHLGQMIVMREPVPDQVAQEFLKYFLAEFAGGKSLYMAVRSAREKLQGLEGDFPCASWLPVICQNPTEVPPHWEELLHRNWGKWVKLGAAFLASLAATGLVVGVRQIGWLEPLELKAFDQLMQVRPDEGADPRLLVVEATADDIKKYGFPLPDGILARVIEKIGAYQPPVMGLDIYRDLPVGTGNAELAKQLQNDRLIVICKVPEKSKIGIAPPPAVIDKERHSFSDIVPDADEIIRRNLLFLDSQFDSPCGADHSFSLRLALDYLYEKQGIAPELTQYLKLKQTVFKPLQINPDKPGVAGGYRKTDLKGYQILLNYRTFKDVARRVSITDVLNGQFDPNWVRDRIVLIGVTDPTKPDNHLTPYQKMPGVLIQAQMVSQILSAVLDKRPLLAVWPQWGEILWIWGWSLVGGVLVCWWRQPLHRGLGTAGAIVILSGICYILLIQGSWVPLVPSAFALVMTGGIVVVYSASIKKQL